jgi:hypothetical protein
LFALSLIRGFIASIGQFGGSSAAAGNGSAPGDGFVLISLVLDRDGFTEREDGLSVHIQIRRAVVAIIA